MCDGTKKCENGMDEPDFCQKVVVTGSDERDGVYDERTSLNTYKQRNGTTIIFKANNNRWVIADGPNPSDSVAKYKSGESSELLLAKGWESDQGKKLMTNLLIFEATAKQVSVTGSRGRNGVYRYHNGTDTYKQQGGGNWMFKENGEMYYEGKTANDNGFICKVRDIKSGGSSEDWSEEWSHIRWTDEQICDKTKNQGGRS